MTLWKAKDKPWGQALPSDVLFIPDLILCETSAFAFSYGVTRYILPVLPAQSLSRGANASAPKDAVNQLLTLLQDLWVPLFGFPCDPP